MNNYFDVDAFFRDYQTNLEKKKFLEEKMKAVIDSGGMDYDTPKVSGSTPISSVESKAIRREKIKAEIDRLEHYFTRCERLLFGLNSEENHIVDIYFKQGKKTRYDVELLADDLGYSVATMYRKIKNVRKAIRYNA